TSLLQRLEPLAHKVPAWYQLQLLAATIAQDAGQFGKARDYYEAALHQLRKEKEALAALAREIEKLMTVADAHAVQTAAGPSFGKPGPEDPIARKKIEQDMWYAVKQLNDLFRRELRPPPLVFLAPSEYNAYT